MPSWRTAGSTSTRPREQPRSSSTCSIPAGVGEGQLRFEALRLKLEEEGLFAEERKRALPIFPKRIGLVTSETGAVYHDVVTVLSRRFPICQLVFCHSAVQGERAPAELVQALQRLADWRDTDGSPIDVAIVGRGGGAPEELACFNDERLARAIFAAPWPVISAVGHETDYTICDFVADHRAPTPSAAAEMVSPDLSALRLDLADLLARGRITIEQALDAAELDLRRTRDRLMAHSPLTRIARDRQATLDQADRARLALVAAPPLALRAARGTPAPTGGAQPSRHAEPWVQHRGHGARRGRPIGRWRLRRRCSGDRACGWYH